MEEVEEVEVFSETETGCEELRLGERETQSEEEEEREEEEDKDAEIFSAWMGRYRAGGPEKGRPEEEGGGGAARQEPPVNLRGGARRRSSLPCQLSAMQFYRLHSAAEPPVSAKVLLQRNSSRGLLLSSPAPPLTSSPVTSPPNAQRRSSFIHPEDAPGHEPGHRTHFRRRNIMSMGDADSLCLICHKEFSQGDDGIQELSCSHTFHKQCIDEWLVSRPSCPTCQTSTLQTC